MKRVLIAGGDLRNRFLLSELAAHGYCVQGFGLGEPAGEKIEWGAFELVVGPVPFSRDGLNLYAPLHAQPIAVGDFLGAISPNATLYAGTIPASALQQHAFRHVDLTKNAWLYEHNLGATCEGIVQIILNHVDFTIAGASILIAGYGKLGKALAAMLAKLDAKVSIHTTNAAEAGALAAGLLRGRIDDLSAYTIIVNTIPAIVFTPAELATARAGSLLIDVASAPGGVDAQCASDGRLSIVRAAGIPGTKAPRTVARAMKQVILEALES